MIYVLIGMSLLFVAIGFIVTENNAKYLLSGYNTMSESDRKKVDLHSYIPYFRKFHIWLGISFFILGLITILISENAGSIFLGVYPVLAYMYFFLRSTKYYKDLDPKWNKAPIGILLVILIFIGAIFGIGNIENKLIFSTEQIEIQGSYGEQLTPSEILSFELIDQLPKITLRTNGFSSGSIKKGYFKTSNGEIIKLILNTDIKPYMLITRKSGKKIYFSAKEKPTEEIFNELKKKFPGIVFKQ